MKVGDLIKQFPLYKTSWMTKNYYVGLFIQWTPGRIQLEVLWNGKISYWNPTLCEVINESR